MPVYTLAEWDKCHARCDRIAHHVPSYVQTTLISKSGQLSISRPPGRISRYHCTPAPHAVERIANTPIFSTTDASLTSFLRFPPEIRIQIYRLLLIYDGTIQYQVCPVKLRLMFRYWMYTGKRLWIRHGIFPSILRCCRCINQEGTPILYGENWFTIEKFYWRTVIGSWDLPKANLDSIKKIHLRCPSWSFAREGRFWKQLNYVDLFPRLKEVKIECRDTGTWEWEAFLSEAATRSVSTLRFTFEFRITRGYPSQLPRGLETYCRELYQPTFERFKDDVWEKKEVTWEFEEYEDDEGLEYVSQDWAMLRLIIA